MGNVEKKLNLLEKKLDFIFEITNNFIERTKEDEYKKEIKEKEESVKLSQMELDNAREYRCFERSYLEDRAQEYYRLGSDTKE